MNEQKKSRVSFFIDGFNCYYRIKEYCKRIQQNKFKWIDYRKLCESLIDIDTQEIVDIYFFTAIPKGNHSSSLRHKTFVQALEHKNIKVLKGYLKIVDKECKVLECNSPVKSFKVTQEKQTDVNLAINLVKDAYENSFDEAIVFSGDTDLIPAIKLVKEKEKKVFFSTFEQFNKLTNRFEHIQIDNLIKSSDGHKPLHLSDLKKHLLPWTISFDGQTISIPNEYKQ